MTDAWNNCSISVCCFTINATIREFPFFATANRDNTLGASKFNTVNILSQGPTGDKILKNCLSDKSDSSISNSVTLNILQNYVDHMGDSGISRMPGCGPNALPKNWI